MPQRILTVFLPFALGYFLSYLYRTVNAVIADELTATLGLTAAGLGLLTSAYFIAFGLFQAPLGILLDRYGPRRVEAALLLVAAAGAAIFAAGESIAVLAVGRTLIGLGVSACLMAALTANVAWWPADRLPLVNGLFMACGGLGAVFATTPVQALLTLTDWRGVFLGLAVATVAVAAVILLVVPDRPRPGAPGPAASWGALLRGTAAVFASPAFRRYAPLTVAVQAGFMSYISLWAGPWLRDVEGLDRAAVATHLQYAAMAMAAGFAGIGVIADTLARRGVPPIVVATTGMTVAMAMQAVLVSGLPVPPAVAWTLYAFSTAGSMIVYAVLARSFAPDMAGRVNTAVNLLVFAAAFTLQAGIGAVIAWFPPVGDGFAPQGHRMALAGVLALQLAALAWQVRPRR
ncbi:MFS transporter [Azospirillum halopraeferens]|uniref:MFS transporter n=1 Tax=Azospirillum halopraeferens TaxID=34010 RepID=UPI000401FB32|nr:MFS transporter [Azospirillum halopraeferens]